MKHFDGDLFINKIIPQLQILYVQTIEGGGGSEGGEWVAKQTMACWGRWGQCTADYAADARNAILGKK